MKKPASCVGCPFYGNGDGFVPDEIVEGAPVAIMAQAPHVNEVLQGKPLVGATGEEMERVYFPRAGLHRGEVSIMNALRCQVTQALDKFPPLDRVETRAALEHCHHAHFKVPSGVKLFVAQGEYALWRLTGMSGADEGTGNGILGWRGWLLPYNPSHADLAEHAIIWTPGPKDLKVLATVHLAATLRDPDLQLFALRDWSKVLPILSGKWPERFPQIEVLPPYTWPTLSAFDTEFMREKPHKLIRYSLAWRVQPHVPVVHVVEAEHAVKVVGLAGARVYGHNWIADIEHLERIFFGQPPRLDDTMYQHAVLWGGLAHDLNSCGSLYARTNRWKHLERANPIQYSGGDALGTLDLGLALDAELDRDPRSRWVYENLQLPLLPVIRRAEDHGQRINHPRVQEVLEQLRGRVAEARVKAEAAAGWPINLGSSPQVGQHLYEIEKLQELLKAR